MANLAFVLAWTAIAAGDPAGDRAAIDAALGRALVGPALSMVEVRAFIEPRIARAPELTTAEAWTADADRLRHEALARVILRGDAAAWDHAPLRVEWLDRIAGGPEYSIRKLRFEAVPGLWVPALLYEPDDLAARGKVPVVLNVNGHDAKGTAADYKQIRCINQARRGMLALNVEWFGMGQLKSDGFRHGLINALDLCGTSGIAVHYEMLRRGLDVLLSHEHADPARVAVAGLSGGGWQTIFIAGLDPRVTLANPVAGFSSYHTRNLFLSDLGDSEQTPSDLAAVVDAATLVAMRAPRPTLLTYNAKDDCCYAAPHALPPLMEAARPAYRLFDAAANLRPHVNEMPGTHNFGLDNRLALYDMLGDHFAPGDPSFPRQELPTEGEIKSPEELRVELPADNLDFATLAARLAEDLPRGSDLPIEREAAARWQSAARVRLRALVRPYDPPAVRIEVEATVAGDLAIARATYRMGTTWTVPAVEVAPSGEGDATTSPVVVIIGDEGRAALGGAVAEAVAAGRRAVAIDPWYLGESRPAERDYLFAILLAAVGERPLGVQAGQVLAVARAEKERTGRPVLVRADGPRTSVIALTAAALDPDAIDGVELRAPLGSLKELIENRIDVQAMPELFGFGLLERFDVATIAALVAPRPIRLIEPSERATHEFAPLKRWYHTLGSAGAAP